MRESVNIYMVGKERSVVYRRKSKASIITNKVYCCMLTWTINTDFMMKSCSNRMLVYFHIQQVIYNSAFYWRNSSNPGLCCSYNRMADIWRGEKTLHNCTFTSGSWLSWTFSDNQPFLTTYRPFATTDLKSDLAKSWNNLQMCIYN